MKIIKNKLIKNKKAEEEPETLGRVITIIILVVALIVLLAILANIFIFNK